MSLRLVNGTSSHPDPAAGGPGGEPEHAPGRTDLPSDGDALEATESGVAGLFGVALHRVSERQVVDAVVHGLADGRGGWICPINLDVLRQVVPSAGLRELVAEADLCVADGMPLVGASRLAGTPLPERVAGSSLITALADAAGRAGASVFFLGGNPGSATAAAGALAARPGGLRVAGTLCPPNGFERDPDALSEIEATLLGAAPDVVFVGLGFPKQDHLIQRLRPLLPEAWFLSCGVSFSFVSGELARAPQWMQRAGLEWLHRLATEPRRLFRRYVVLDIPFGFRLFGYALASRLRRGPRA
jgi:N-acetylglucosaminyldiphosphoundecaprenol N-acetyl-beta-D-mannosaminyltransferase